MRSDARKRDWKSAAECAVEVKSHRIWRGDGAGRTVVDSVTVDGRPWVLIDPEDDVVVERLEGAYEDALRSLPKYVSLRDTMRHALRSLATPPKPSVYSHIVAERGHGVVQALCGKVWTPGATDVTVAGECPDCKTFAGKWTA